MCEKKRKSLLDARISQARIKQCATPQLDHQARTHCDRLHLSRVYLWEIPSICLITIGQSTHTHTSAWRIYIQMRARVCVPKCTRLSPSLSFSFTHRREKDLRHITQIKVKPDYTISRYSAAATIALTNKYPFSAQV
jgi:hypothetical protein